MILVTGTEGMLAANVIPILTGMGYSVRGVLRAGARYMGGEHPGLELVEGDFTSDECLRRVLPGCSAVIHAAAETSLRGRNYGEYYEANVRGTRRLVEAAIDHGVKRFVAIGSICAFGYGSREIPGCELNEMCEPFASSYYVRSKYEALNAAMSYRDRITVTGAAPAFMLGPHGAESLAGRLIGMGYGRRIVFHPPGGCNFVHAADAAQGVVNALENGENGETYLLCSENLTYGEFFKKLGAVTGRRALSVKIPRLALYLAGGTGSCLRFMGLRTAISLPNMRMLCVAGWYHNYKASRDLGVQFRPAEDAIRDAVEWMTGEGMLRPFRK